MNNRKGKSKMLFKGTFNLLLLYSFHICVWHLLNEVYIYNADTDVRVEMLERETILHFTIAEATTTRTQYVTQGADRRGALLNELIWCLLRGGRAMIMWWILCCRVVAVRGGSLWEKFWIYGCSASDINPQWHSSGHEAAAMTFVLIK